MIDCRLLMIGNNTTSVTNHENDNKFSIFRSNCYFDWMSLTKIHLDNDSVEKCFQEWYKLYSQKRRESLNCYHIQQSFMLISDAEATEGTSFEEAPLLYISLISISYTANGIASFSSIKKILKESGIEGINLYHCLDHCNYVLVCDGSKIELEDYLNLLMKIKNMMNSNERVIVHDITTLYGYNFERLREFSSSEHIRLILSINKADENSLALAKDINELQEKWGDIFNCIGRYDHMLVSKPMTWKDFSTIAEVLYKNQAKMLASRIHICLESQDETLGDLIDDNNIETDLCNKNVLIDKLETTFNDNSKAIYEKINIFDSHTATQINYALHEVYYSICTMLRRAFSNYFVLCFYESFCQLLEYINKKLLSKDNMTDKDIDYYSEKIYDLINSYFIYLRTLIASTLHSERRFVQADPHQLTYFDIPPKLIAFYTAFARKMSKTLSRTLKSKNRYTFLIVPDFKKDIYVESLTQNRDFQEELNILIIHINEKSMYDISQTTKILAHEIAHHAGLGRGARRERAIAYMKCILASKICMNMDADIYKTTQRDDWQELFNSIVDVFIKCIKKKFDIEILMTNGKYDSTYVYSSDVPRYFYSDVFIREYDRFLLEHFQDDNFWNDIADQLFKKNLPWKYFDKYFECDDPNTLPSKLSSAYNEGTGVFLKKYAINKFLDFLRDEVMKSYRFPNLSFDANPYSTIEYAFKEGIADIQMLCLISPSRAKAKDVDRIYSEMFSVLNGRYERDKDDSGMRQLAVRSSFCDGIVYSDFEEADTNDKIKATIYINYLKEQLISFFKSITPMKNFFDNDGEMSSSFAYERIISPFLKGEPNVDEVVNIIDDVINEYQHEL